MSGDIERKLSLLREDYTSVTGKPFTYFWCPILHSDDDVELCRAHIINQALRNELGQERAWTVQRKDVDNFYGSVFESDFVLIQYEEDEAFSKAFFRGELKLQLKPKVLVNGKEIGFFVASGHVPSEFSTIRLEDEVNSIDLALKLSPNQVERSLNENWEVEVSKDIRVQAIASLAKAAHLTMFALFGYAYALSATGRFVGYDILGRFFQMNKDYDRKTSLRNAISFFKEHARIVRPVLVLEDMFRGTIDDKRFLVCQGANKQFWAYIILVNAGNKMNAVLLPTLTDEETTVRYLDFMRGSQSTLYGVHIAEYSQGKILFDEREFEIEWGTIEIK